MFFSHHQTQVQGNKNGEKSKSQPSLSYHATWASSNKVSLHKVTVFSLPLVHNGGKHCPKFWKLFFSRNLLGSLIAYSKTAIKEQTNWKLILPCQNDGHNSDFSYRVKNFWHWNLENHFGKRIFFNKIWLLEGEHLFQYDFRNRCGFAPHPQNTTSDFMSISIQSNFVFGVKIGANDHLGNKK